MKNIISAFTTLFFYLLCVFGAVNNAAAPNTQSR